MYKIHLSVEEINLLDKYGYRELSDLSDEYVTKMIYDCIKMTLRSIKEEESKKQELINQSV